MLINFRRLKEDSRISSYFRRRRELSWGLRKFWEVSGGFRDIRMCWDFLRYLCCGIWGLESVPLNKELSGSNLLADCGAGDVLVLRTGTKLLATAKEGQDGLSSDHKVHGPGTPHSNASHIWCDPPDFLCALDDKLDPILAAGNIGNIRKTEV